MRSDNLDSDLARWLVIESEPNDSSWPDLTEAVGANEAASVGAA